MAMSFKQLRDANTQRHLEWSNSDQPYSLLYRATELSGEVGELCNVIKKIERERMGLVGSRANMEELAQELADVIIAADLLAMDLGLDMAEIVKQKFNMTSEKYKLNTKIE